MKPACQKCGGSLDSDRHRYCALNPIADAILAHKPKPKSKPLKPTSLEDVMKVRQRDATDRRRMMTTKFCKDCRYFYLPAGLSPGNAKCKSQKKSNATSIDLVTGETLSDDETYFLCRTQRTYESNSCGAEGKWFEAKA